MSLDTIDRLERLARLHTNGALDAREYAAAKAQLLSVPEPASIIEPAAQPASEIDDLSTTIADARLSPIWQMRFRFFDEHGLPGTPSYRAALRSISPWPRMRLVFSPLAMLLGPFYYFYLGLWRPTLVLLGVTLALDLLIYQIGLSDDLEHVLWVIPATLHGACVVPLYYLQQRYERHRWNPFVWRPQLPLRYRDDSTTTSDE